MRDERPSVTAFGVALRRAAHQTLDIPRVFEDPLALAIIGIEGRARLEIDSQQSQRARGLRAFLAARSRYVEDELARAVERGIRQYVVLGAGLDTFAYRNPYPESILHVFEVDHPATQSWKRCRLKEGGIPIPSSMTFVPIDFEDQTLADELAQAGFQGDQPTFFSWLGVVVYLTRGAVMKTLRFVAAMPSGSEVVFDYGVPPSTLNWLRRFTFKRLTRRLAEKGEPFLTFFEPSTLASELRQIGFGHIEDLGVEEMNERYFGGRSDGLRLGAGLSHLMKARI
jgi:methyltransferase (TIGR00027 family)